MNDNALIIGIDCATKANKIGVAKGFLADDGRVIVADAWRGSAAPVGDWQSVVKGWVEEATNVLIALDAPLGWPEAMGTALASHVAGASIQQPADCMFQRATDRMVRDQIGLKPLEVGANLIARTAHSALEFLSRLGGVALASRPKQCDGRTAIEVYPAATLSAHGQSYTKYKKVGQKNREDVVKWVFGRVEVKADPPNDEVEDAIRNGDHELDAVICLLAAADFLSGEVIAPTPAEQTLHNKEGWIWVWNGGGAARA